MKTQQAPDLLQAAGVFPVKFASKNSQFKIGGILYISKLIARIVNKLFNQFENKFCFSQLIFSSRHYLISNYKL